MTAITLHFKDASPIEIKVNKNDKLSVVKELAVKHFNLEKYFPDNMRLRMFSNEILTEPLINLETCCNDIFKSYYKQQIYVEVKENEEEFPKYSVGDITIKCSGYNSETGVWSRHRSFSFPRDSLLSYVKEKLSYAFGIPVENLLLIEETASSSSKILERDNVPFLNNAISIMSSKFYVEPKSGEEVPRAYQHIDKLKYNTQIQFTNPDEKEYKHTINVDRRITLLELKNQISSIINLGVDEFLVYREHYNETKYEDDMKLTMFGIYSATKFLVVRGRPLKKGEMICKVHLYDLVKDKKEELLDLVVRENCTILEFRQEIINKVNIIKQNDSKVFPDFPQDVNRIRIRKYTGRPSTVYMNSKTIKDITDKYYFSTNDVTIQILPENQIEEKNSDQDVIIILKQFFPDKLELGPPMEVKIQKTDKISDAKNKISQLVSIPPDQLSVAFGSFYENSVLGVPNLKWYPPLKDSNSSNSKYNNQLNENQSINSLADLEDGTVVLCRDTNVPLKEITETDKRKINQIEELKRRDKSNKSKEEQSLSIHIKDVDIF